MLDKELPVLYSLPNVIWMILTKRVRRAGNVARMEEKRKACRILARKPYEKKHFEDPRQR
jgi:hypothetical protein